MKTVSWAKPNSYFQLLGTLYLLLNKIRHHGIMSVENDVEHPKESVLFNTINEYDSTHEVVYIFVCDALRLMVSGNFNAEDMQRYMTAYRKTSVLSREHAALFDCVELTLMATLHGNTPSVAVEYGRQGILPEAKPTFQELEDFIQIVKKGPEPTRENIDARLEKFYTASKTEDS